MLLRTRPPEMKLVLPAQSLEFDMALLQGLWTEALYLKLSEQTNQLIEFTDGIVEALPVPTRYHQVLLLFLYDLLRDTIRPLGKVLVAPMRLQIRAGKYREPDLLVLCNAADSRNQDAFWFGADLVVEIVSPNDPERDTMVKRADYAEARIPEYWIVNPIDESITVLVIDGDAYREHGIFHRGQSATSLLLPSLTVSVDNVFDAT
jgi:Uma2 family endonuclease